jgi:hypothetical protein
LIISGHHESAKEHIIKVINDVNLNNNISEFDKRFLTDTKLILNYINISVIKAQSLLLKWEENNKRSFIIE